MLQSKDKQSHATSFNKSIESLNQSQILQIAMNVPNGNWNFYEHIVLEREDDLLSLMNIESCYCMS